MFGWIFRFFRDGMIPEGDTRFSQGRASSGSGEQLSAEFAFEARQLAADDGFRHPQAPRSHRDAAAARDFDEGPDVVNVHSSFPIQQQLVAIWHAIATVQGTPSCRCQGYRPFEPKEPRRE